MYYFILIIVCAKDNTFITPLKIGEKKTSCDSHLTSQLLFACIRRPFWILCILKMPQVLFTATFTMLILLAKVTK